MPKRYIPHTSPVSLKLEIELKQICPSANRVNLDKSHRHPVNICRQCFHRKYNVVNNKIPSIVMAVPGSHTLRFTSRAGPRRRHWLISRQDIKPLAATSIKHWRIREIRSDLIEDDRERSPRAPLSLPPASASQCRALIAPVFAPPFSADIRYRKADIKKNIWYQRLHSREQRQSFSVQKMPIGRWVNTMLSAVSSKSYKLKINWKSITHEFFVAINTVHKQWQNSQLGQIKYEC